MQRILREGPSLLRYFLSSSKNCNGSSTYLISCTAGSHGTDPGDLETSPDQYGDGWNTRCPQGCLCRTSALGSPWQDWEVQSGQHVDLWSHWTLNRARYGIKKIGQITRFARRLCSGQWTVPYIIQGSRRTVQLYRDIGHRCAAYYIVWTII